MRLSSRKALVSFLFFLPFLAVSQDTLRLSRQQCEALFIQQNLTLIAGKLKVPEAEARVQQARLWPNPVLDIDEINLWAGQKQVALLGEGLPGLGNGNFGRNRQVSLSVEQLIYTAGKRQKRIDLEQITVEQSQQYFEETLRNLKAGVRDKLTQMQYLQLSSGLYETQLSNIRRITQAYKKQADEGHVSRGAYARLKALELETTRTLNSLASGINEAAGDLRLWMNLPAGTILEITSEGYTKDVQNLQGISLAATVEQAKEWRPDLRLGHLEQNYFSKLYAYEKARKVPDLTLKAGYDRGGNFMYNFFGLGLSMDLPVFDRNQGNIQAARLGLQQAEILTRQVGSQIENEIVLAYQNLLNAIKLQEEIDPDFEKTLDELLGSYTKNLLNHSISLLEYLDFTDAYLENKKIMLDTLREINNKAEEFNYAAGRDIL